ncbi:MAG TPA: TadE/TadG family type IV pilus assembly protein [Actinomycetota bacterium]|nr:TadE/TadG family type IV pilus assembly protein [Actinomycetota bacterium]
MKTPISRTAFMRRLRREEGAEAVEFALIAPVLFFLVFGVIYLLLLFAAQLSLGYATNVGVRYAAIPTDAFGNYPSAGQVLGKAVGSTPFFSESSCSTPSLSSGATNRPVSLTMNCNFPNPAGGAVNAIRQTFFGGSGDISNTVALSATAQSRKE